MKIKSIQLKNIVINFSSNIFGRRLKFNTYDELEQYIHKINDEIEIKKLLVSQLTQVKTKYIAQCFNKTEIKKPNYQTLNEVLLEHKEKKNG